MKKSEISQILDILTAAYPLNYRNITDSERRDILALWVAIFERDSVVDVAIAVKQFIRSDTKGFAPAPGQIAALMDATRPKPALLALMSHEEQQQDQQRMLDFIERMQSRAERNNEPPREIPAECVVCGKSCHKHRMRSL